MGSGTTEEVTMMDWNGNAGWWNGGMIVMGVFWLLLIGLAIWAVIRLTRRPDGAPRGPVESARQNLDRRFASGEIDATAYAESRRVLEGRSIDQVRD
jgi:putative membrane protein